MTREFVLKFLGDTTGLNRSLDQVDSRFGSFNQRLAAVTTASVAVGAGLEAMARGQAENSASVRRLTELTGMQSDAVRTLASDLATVDSPLEEVLGLLEQGTRLGIESEQGLREFASFWDTVGDATGIATEQLAASSSALQTVGVDVDNLGEAMDALGFIQTNTTDGVTGFLELLEKKGPEIAEFGLSVDDTAALLAVMERELGLTSRTARTEFDQALGESDGTMQGLLDTLGVSQEQFEEYRSQVDGAGESLENLAEANTSVFTPMQRLQHELSELTFKFGEQVAVLAEFAPALIAVGPAMKGVQMAAALLSTGLKAAFLPLLLPPTGLIILGLAAVVAAGILVWKNWDTIKEKAGQLASWLGDKIGPMKDAVVAAFGAIGDAIGAVVDKIGDLLEMLGRIPEAVGAAADAAAAAPGAIGSAVPGSGSGVANFAGRVGQGILDANLGARAAGWFGRRFDSGGVVPGPRGSDQIVLAHGGETILPTHRTGGMGGTTVVINVQGSLLSTAGDLEKAIVHGITQARQRGLAV